MRLAGYNVSLLLPAIATLEIFTGYSPDPVVHQLKKPIHRLGRGRDCDIVVSSPLVSRVHCTFVWRYSKGNPFYQLIDGDRDKRKPSSNGVFVNGKRVDEILEQLRHEDLITLGATPVRIFYRLLLKREIISPDEEGKSTLGDAGDDPI